MKYTVCFTVCCVWVVWIFICLMFHILHQLI